MAAASARTFSSLPELKRHIETTYKQSFCDICVAGRKVFVCEQLLYSKTQLERHNRMGDETGPLAESGFKGHPLCKFCKQRFFDSHELWRHMESAHEHCFLCRQVGGGERNGLYVWKNHISCLSLPSCLLHTGRREILYSSLLSMMNRRASPDKYVYFRHYKELEGGTKPD